MLYGERLKLAMERRGAQLGREIARLEIANVAGCKTQNVGMILNNAKKKDQKFTAESHAAVAAFLRVNPDWLLNETGTISPSVDAPSKLSNVAIELGVLFDMIPESDTLRRALAYNKASSAIMQVLRDDISKVP